MATALAAGRWQPWQAEVVQLHGEVGPHGHGGSFGVRVRAFGASHASKSHSQQPRGKICRIPPFRTSSPRRVTLTSAMSEERDITEVQETDKVSGEWWNPILDAVRDWSHDKLLGLAELADGSLFFSFGTGSDSKAPRPAKATSSPQQKADREVPSATTQSLNSRPPRHSSSFRKLSPIPASRKKASELETTATEVSPTGGAAADTKKPQKREKSNSPGESAGHPQRPISSFSKRSPIPKSRAPPSLSEKESQAAEAPNSAALEPATELQSSPGPKEILDRGKESDTIAKTASAGSPVNKRTAKVVVREEIVVEVAETSTETESAKKTTSNFAAESEEATVDVAAGNGAATPDLASYKLPELRSLAKARGLKGYSKLKKGQLVDLLAGLEN